MNIKEKKPINNPIFNEKLRNLKIGESFNWDCMEGPRVGRHKKKDCTLWRRAKEQQGNFRRRYDWGKDYYIVRNCENGVFAVQRYDKEKEFENTTRERIHFSSLLIKPVVSHKRSVPADVRKAVYMRDGGKCVYCGRIDNLQIDHKFPNNMGGTSEVEDNLQVLCVDCNKEKGTDFG